MAPYRQGGHFGHDAQPDLFGAEPAPAYRPDPDKVRRRLEKILAEARAAQKLPWDSARVSLYRTMLSADDQLAAGGGGRAIALRIRDGIGAA